MTSNHLLLYRLAELMLEHEQHFLPVDLLFEDEQIGDFVKSIQIDSPYQQMLLEGVLTESVINETLYVSFTLEGYFHFVLGEVIFNQSEGKSAESLMHIVEENKLNGAKEGVEQCLIRDVQKDDLNRLIWLIDEGTENNDFITTPLIASLKSFGVEKTIIKILENPTENDWKFFLQIENTLIELQLYELHFLFLNALMPLNLLNCKAAIQLGLRAISILENELARNYFSLIDLNSHLIQNDPELLFDLGVCLDKLGDFDLAQSYFEKCLAIDILKLGPEHLDIASLYDSIAHIFYQKNNFEAAIEYAEKSLRLKLCNSETKQQNLAYTYNSLGILYSFKKRFQDAIIYLKKGLDIYLNVLGKEHRFVSSVLNNIGNYHFCLNDLDKALFFSQKALNVNLKVLGSDHEEVAKTYHNVGNLWATKGVNNNALSNYDICLAIYKNRLGEKHPLLGNLYKDIGFIRYSKAEYLKALEMILKCLEIELIYLDEQHPNVAYSFFIAGNCHVKLNSFIKAIKYYEKASEIIKKGGIAFELGRSYEALHEKESALEYYIQSAQIRKNDPYVGLEAEATQESISNALRVAKELGKETELPVWMR